MARGIYVPVKKPEKRELPSGYTQVEYIQNTGTQYIDTGFTVTQENFRNMRIVADIEFSVMTDETHTSIMGIHVPGPPSDILFFGVNGVDSKCVPYLGLGSSEGGIGYSVNLSNYNYKEAKRYIWDFDLRNEDINIGDLVENHKFSIGSFFHNDYNFYLFAINKGNSADVMNVIETAKLYNFKVYVYDADAETELLEKELVPCINPEGEAGLYDVVKDLFLPNAGTGAFKTGVAIKNPIKKVKKVYVNTKKILNELNPGDTVYLKENGSPVEFYIATHDYEPELNGAGRTLFVRKDCYNKHVWHTSDLNAYATSAIDSWLNGDYKSLLDEGIQELIGTTKFKYTPGNRNAVVSELERAVFLLSATEFGQAQSYFNVEGSALPNADNYKIAYLNGSAVVQWTRSPNTGMSATNFAIIMNDAGNVYDDTCSVPHGSRPAFTLPSDTEIDDDKISLELSLGQKAEGSTVLLNENGSPVEFYVAKHDYEPELNGEGRTLLVRKDCYDSRKWHSSNINAYATSDIDTWLNGTYKGLLDSGIQRLIGTTKFKYTPGNGNDVVSELERSIFLLSMTELGLSGSFINIEGTRLPNHTDYVRAKLKGSLISQFTRSPDEGTETVLCSNSTGGISPAACVSILGSRPVFTLPKDLKVSNDGKVQTAEKDITANNIPKKIKKIYAVVQKKDKSIADMVEGSTVLLNENGSPVEFYIAKHNYEPELNGGGRTLLVRKDCYNTQIWNASNMSNYSASSIKGWLEQTYRLYLDADIQNLIGKTKIMYTVGYTSNELEVYTGSVFLLSLTELGFENSRANTEGSPLPIASTLQIAKMNGSAVSQWTRSPDIATTSNVLYVKTDGTAGIQLPTDSFGSRPALTLPSNLKLDEDRSVLTTAAECIKEVKIIFSDEPEIKYQGTVASLSNERTLDVNTANVGNYVLYGPGAGIGYVSTVDAFNSNLTRTSPSGTQKGKCDYGASYNGNYAVFAGGAIDNDPNNYMDNTVDGYDKNLSRKTATVLSQKRTTSSHISNGKHAIFAGGSRYGGMNNQYEDYANVDAYDQNLTRSTPSNLPARGRAYGRQIGSRAIFMNITDFSSDQHSMYSYDQNLTRTSATSLSDGVMIHSAAINGFAVFASNNKYVANAYDVNLTRTIISNLPGKGYSGATDLVRKFAMFAASGNTVTIDENLVVGTAEPIASTRGMGGSIGNYALFFDSDSETLVGYTLENYDPTADTPNIPPQHQGGNTN